MQKSKSWAEYLELAGLFCLQAMATSMWFVPLSLVLNAHGLHQITAYAYATTAGAAFISPLVFGAMADRHAPPVKVLRGLSVAAALAMMLVALAIHWRWNAWLVLALIQFQAIFATPTGSIATAIIFSRLRNSHTEFGPVRAGATFGWMAGCWVVSALNADASVRAACADAVLWLVLVAFTFLLPSVEPPKSGERLTLRQRLGWDAVELMKNHDHRVIFITAALFYVPLAAFYPFTPLQLRELGLTRTSAWMTLGQVSEMVAMFSLAFLLARWRLKWVVTVGLAFGVVRFILCALNRKAFVLAGVSLHGLSLVLVLITAQVYVDQRVPATWRVRAQALVYLMTSGLGNFLGFLGTGWWFDACARPGGTQWTLFWGGLSAAVAAVLIYFVSAYHGKGLGFKRAE